MCAHPAPRPAAVSMVSQSVLGALSTELSVLGCDRLNAAITSFWRFLQHRIPASTAWSCPSVCPASPCPIPACLGWLCSPRNLDPHSRRSGLMMLLHLLSPLPGPDDCCPSEGAELSHQAPEKCILCTASWFTPPPQARHRVLFTLTLWRDLH